MVVIFSEELNTQSHDEFQRWRDENETGYFINLKSKKLHRAKCPHLEDTERDKNVWGSLTKSEKVFSNNLEELKLWANKNSLPFDNCKDCKL